LTSYTETKPPGRPKPQPRGVADRKEPTNLSVALYDALERAVKALRAHPDLPPSITLTMTDDGLWVSPWVRGAPMTALLGWHEEMTETEREYETNGIEGGDSYAKVTVRGLLDDVPVIAQAVTFQPVTGARNKVSLVELRKLAKVEEPY
jgi:hypothetical protein